MVEGEIAADRLTGLQWPIDANRAEFPLDWDEALAYVAAMNASRALGFSDWRLPNRRELRSLISHHTRRPALPEGHPFRNLFLNWYWSSTTAALRPNHAWYVNLDGGRMFYGGKDQAYLVWPVRGGAAGALLPTGQTACFDRQGRFIDCRGSGQDGEYAPEVPWGEERFEPREEGVRDGVTGLLWARCADAAHGPVSWTDALERIGELNRGSGGRRWRLPGINELESLVDCARAQPALPAPHPFIEVQEVYWSSTTSRYEPDWAWALYLDKGAVGVGQKAFARFHVWAVSDAAG